MECHIIIPDDLFGICQPFVQGLRVPGDVRILERVRVFERPNRARWPSEDAAKPWTFFVIVDSVATSAASFKDVFSSRGVVRA
jgi:hypothetical protein